jgi:5-methylcytosine-specific restriction enzyme subunit McrC
MIPVANLYYLLSYAWDVPAGRGAVRATAIPFKRQPDFFAAVLAHGTERLLKRGLDRGYTTVEEETSRPRGRLDVTATLRRNRPGVAVCRADDPTHDTPPNRVLKATLRSLVKCTDVNRDRAARCHALAGRFADVPDVELSPGAFAAVRLGRNTEHYGVLLHVCRLLFENRLPDPRPGAVAFADFTLDDRQMANVFERFVRNFYRREQTIFPRVTGERFAWREVEGSADDVALLPELRTDVSLASPTRKLVIDAKFYRATLSSRFDAESVHAANLYQLFAYLKNQRPVPGQTVEGMLLYPTVGRELDLRYVLHGFPVRVATVDLNQPWEAIHERMLHIAVGLPTVRGEALRDPHRGASHGDISVIAGSSPWKERR